MLVGGTIVSVTLGDTLGSNGLHRTCVATVVGVVGGIIALGKSSARCRIFAIFNNALRVVSPVSSDGVVDEGGVVRSVIISEAACFKKSSR